MGQIGGSNMLHEGEHNGEQQHFNGEGEIRMRQTWGKGKMKPKISISHKFPREFGLMNVPKTKSKKNFTKFQKEHVAAQAEKNSHIANIDAAVDREEYKHMNNMLEPIHMDRERAAYSKIDQYNSNN